MKRRTETGKMAKKGKKSRNITPKTPAAVSTRSRNAGKSVKQEQEPSAAAGVCTRSSLRFRKQLNSQQQALAATAAALHLPDASPQISGVSTPNGHSSQLQNIILPEGTSLLEPTATYLTSKGRTRLILQTQPQCAAQNMRAVLNREITQRVNSLLSGQHKSTTGDNHATCSKRSDTPLVPTGTNLQTPTGHSSPLLLEKFIKTRSILDKDTNTLQIFQTQIQHDAQDADGEVCVKPEPICLDLEDGADYIVGRDYEYTLRKIISAYGDIAKDCSFTSLDIRTDFLKTVCKIYKKLESSNIFDIDVSEMSRICQNLDELQHAKIEVKWLIDRISQVIELTKELPIFLTFRNIVNRKAGAIQQKAAILEEYKRQLEFHQARSETLKELIQEEGEELASEKRVTEVFDLFRDSWVKKVKPLGQPIAHGLL